MSKRLRLPSGAQKKKYRERLPNRAMCRDSDAKERSEATSHTGWMQNYAGQVTRSTKTASGYNRRTEVGHESIVKI